MFEIVHVGVPVKESMPGEKFSASKGLYYTNPADSPFAFEYCRFMEDSIFPEAMRNVVHVAAKVDDIDSYIAAADEVIFPKFDNGSSWLAFVKKDGIVFELKQQK